MQSYLYVPFYATRTLTESVEQSGSTSDASAAGLHASDESVRLATYQRLLEDAACCTPEALVALLSDISVDASTLLASVSTRILDVLGSDTVLETCTRTINHAEASRAVIQNHVAFLAGPFSERHSSASAQVLCALWSRLLFCKSTRKTAIAVWNGLTGTICGRTFFEGFEPATIDNSTNWKMAEVLAGPSLPFLVSMTSPDDDRSEYLQGRGIRPKYNAQPPHRMLTLSKRAGGQVDCYPSGRLDHSRPFATKSTPTG